MRAAAAAGPRLLDAPVIPRQPLTTAPVVVAREAAALSMLGRRVVRQSHPDALRLAFQAYYNDRAAHP